MNIKTALQLVKTRLNRLSSDTTLDDYLTARIKDAAERLQNRGITLDPQSSADLMLLVDFTVYLYNNRDSEGAEPDWLRYEIRQRWLTEKAVRA